jgi:hypothetical protein
MNVKHGCLLKLAARQSASPYERLRRGPYSPAVSRPGAPRNARSSRRARHPSSIATIAFSAQSPGSRVTV